MRIDLNCTPLVTTGTLTPRHHAKLVTHVLALIVAGLALLYVSSVLLLWRFQEQIVFQPPSGVAASDVAARRVRYRSEDGVELFAFLVGECDGDLPFVLAFHGNADLSRWFVPWATQVAREADVCVMLPEYRGYDGLRGVPSYAGSAHDARAALTFARESLNVAPDRFVYYGHSLGTAIAAELAASAPPRSLVLQSPFSSARAMSRRLFVPGVSVFWGLISRVHFDTNARVAALDVPVSVSHGDKDLIIPAAMGREVFAAARRPGELLIVPGAGHNDVPEVGRRAYWTWLVRAVHAGDLSSGTRDAPTRTRSAP
jgi:fermentation-respiration switch protein FrsA (DUF1100 family)